jgi:hypothetical protein
MYICCCYHLNDRTMSCCRDFDTFKPQRTIQKGLSVISMTMSNLGCILRSLTLLCRVGTWNAQTCISGAYHDTLVLKLFVQPFPSLYIQSSGFKFC